MNDYEFWQKVMKFADKSFIPGRDKTRNLGDAHFKLLANRTEEQLGKKFFAEEFNSYDNNFRAINKVMRPGSKWPPTDLDMKISDIEWKPHWRSPRQIKK